LAFHLLAHYMLPAACFVVHERPIEADYIGEESLRKPMLAHDMHGSRAALEREREMPIVGDNDKPVSLHSTDGLRHRGAGMPDALRNARTQRHDALFFEVENRAQVHLGGVNEIGHGISLSKSGFSI